LNLFGGGKRGSSCNTIDCIKCHFFCEEKVLEQAVGDLKAFSTPSRQRKLPVVLTKAEVSALLGQISGR